VEGGRDIVAVTARGDAALVRGDEGLWLVAAGRAPRAAGEASLGGLFTPDDRFAVIPGTVMRPRCGSSGRTGVTTIVEVATGTERTVDGDFAGLLDEGTIRVAVHTADCGPAGGMRNHWTSHLVVRLDGATATEGDRAKAVMAFGPGGRALVRAREVAGGIGGDITECTYAGREGAFEVTIDDCRAASPFAWSRNGAVFAHSVARSGARAGADVVVRRVTDGVVLGTLDGGEPLGTVGLAGPTRAGVCLSPDGAWAIVARADARLVRGRVDGTETTDLGMGSCAGYDPSGRFLLVYSTGGRRVPGLLGAGGDGKDRRSLEGLLSAAWIERP
jgi:hypothetical protein